MPDYVLLASPLILLLAARRIALRRGRQDADAIVGFILVALGVMVWPTSHALALDAAVGVPGLGHLLTDTLILIGFSLFFNFAAKMHPMAPRLRHALFGGALILITLHCLFWLLANLTIPGKHTYLFYNRYSSHPVQLFLTWLVLGIAIIYTASLYLWSGVTSLGPRYQARVRAMALSTSIIAGGTVLYGVVVLVQVVAGAAGVDSATATHITAPIISAMAVVALVSTSVMLFARRGWNYLQDLFSLRRQRELMELESERQLRIYHRIVHMSTWINERLLRVRQDYSAPIAVEHVTRECKRLKISLERCLMAREAVRIITLSFENVMESPYYAEDELQERKGMVEYFILQMGDGSFYYDHVFKIAALAVAPQGLLDDITMPGEIEPWHRELAAIVAEGLRRSRLERMTDAS